MHQYTSNNYIIIVPTKFANNTVQ